MLKISSRHNPKLKYLKQFHHRKHREREGKFLIEGVRVAEEALGALAPVETLVFTAGSPADPRTAALAETAAERGIAVWEVEPPVLQELALTETPQGVVGLVRKVRPALEQVLAGSADGIPLVLVVDGIQDPGNLGSIVRTADACAVNGVVLLKDSVDLYHPKVVRATAGSIFHLDTVDQVEPSDLVAALKRHRFQLLAGDPGGDLSLYECDFDRPTAVVVGHETRGTGAVIRNAVDHMVYIPMPGCAESLNVGVATALLIYESVRRRA